MTRPGVGDLDCGAADCCDSGAVGLDDIAADIIAWFDDTTGTVPEPDPPATPTELAVLTRYAAAIETAFAQISDRVCFARYVADCEATIDLCVPASCAGAGCDPCARPSIDVSTLAEHIAADRILEATVNGDACSINGDPDGAAWDLVTLGPWSLYGPAATGGTATLVITAKPPRVEFAEAIKSLACRIVPQLHASNCDAGSPADAIELRQAGMLGDPIADGLNRKCCQSRVAWGRRDPVSSIRWASPE